MFKTGRSLTGNYNDTYRYRFTDQEPDTYKLNVWQDSGPYSLEYRLSDTFIVSTSGS